MATDLSIVIPVYNAKALIANTINELTEVLKKTPISYEILLRDDGSNDGSAEIMKPLPKRYPHVQCFYNAVNRGLGFTLRQLFQDAKADCIVYCDCDLPFGADVLTRLYEELGAYDMVVASRYRGARARVGFIRKACSRLYYVLCKLLFHVSVFDIGSGSVAIKKKTFEKINLQAEGFDFHIELYAKAKRRGASIKEIAASMRPTRTGSFHPLTHGPRTVFATLKLWFNLRKTHDA